MTMPQRYMLILYGPTGVGKTDCALSLAQRIPAEIINADVGQFYVPLTIGTAKPSWKTSTVPHHLFDILDEPRDITVTEYRNLVIPVLNEVWQRGNIPIIVGGSGFYIASLLFPPPSLPKEIVDSTFQDEKNLWEQLFAIDPDRAQQIHPHDTYRITRALDIWYSTGTKPSQYIPTYQPIAPFLLVWLTRDRHELYERINQRVIQMFNQGWLEEVMALRGTEWEKFLLKKKLIGYDDIIQYLRQTNPSQSMEDLIATIAQKTRNYAKRQITFWTMLKKKLIAVGHKENDQVMLPGIKTFDLTLRDLDLYIKLLLQELNLYTSNQK